MKISIVIPVFNDTASLSELLSRLCKVAVENNYIFQFIIVDDGSIENDTWQCLKDLRRKNSDENITLIRLYQNNGQHLATLIGLMHVQTRWAITMDADLQHPPEEIPKLVRALNLDGCDLVYGTAVQGHPVYYRILSDLFKLLTHKYNNPVDRGASSFRAMETSLTHDISLDYPFVVIDTPLQNKAKNARLVTTEHHKSHACRSTYTTPKRLRLAITAFCSGKPFYRSVLAIAAGIYTLGITHSLFSGQKTITSYSGGIAIMLIGVLLLSSLVILFKKQRQRIRRIDNAISEIIR